MKNFFKAVGFMIAFTIGVLMISLALNYYVLGSAFGLL